MQINSEGLMLFLCYADGFVVLQAILSKNPFRYEKQDLKPEKLNHILCSIRFEYFQEVNA
jgi:hypothetical protein